MKRKETLSKKYGVEHMKKQGRICIKCNKRGTFGDRERERERERKREKERKKEIVFG